jgi:hypothetical protein
VLPGEHLAAVEAVLGRDRAADELLALRQGARSLARLCAEARDACGVHAGRVVAQIGVEGGRILQPVVHRAADLPVHPGGVREHFGRQEAGQLQHVRDVVAEPGVERSLDGGVRLELDLVDDLACAREDFAHEHKGSKRVRRSA